MELSLTFVAISFLFLSFFASFPSFFCASLHARCHLNIYSPYKIYTRFSYYHVLLEPSYTKKYIHHELVQLIPIDFQIYVVKHYILWVVKHFVFFLFQLDTTRCILLHKYNNMYGAKLEKCLKNIQK